MKVRAMLAMAALVAMTATADADQVAGGTEVIAFNYGIPTGFYAPLYVAEDLRLFEKHGLKPTFFSFQSGAPLLAGLKSGSLDVVTTGLASVFALGQGIPITYLVWQGDAAQAEGLIVRADVGVDAVKELGRLGKIGAPTGTCAQISLFHAARAAGVEYKGLDIVNIAPPLYANALHSKSIDAGVSWSPYLFELQVRGHKIAGFDPEWVPGGGACPEMTLAREAVLEANPELGLRLVRVHAEALEAIEADPQVAIRAVARRLNISPEVAQAVFDRYFADYPTLEKQLDSGSRYAMVGDDGLLAQLDLASRTFVELGVIREPVPIEQLRAAIDPQYIKAYLDSKGERP